MSRLPERQQNAVKAATPILTMGITFGVRKGLAAAYKAKTGRPAPLVTDRDSTILSRVLWAAAVAAVVVLVEAVVIEALSDDD